MRIQVNACWNTPLPFEDVLNMYLIISIDITQNNEIIKHSGDFCCTPAFQTCMYYPAEFCLAAQVLYSTDWTTVLEVFFTYAPYNSGKSSLYQCLCSPHDERKIWWSLNLPKRYWPCSSNEVFICIHQEACPSFENKQAWR